MERLRLELIDTAKNALTIFGLEHQMKKAIEELFELIIELYKLKDKSNENRAEVIDEIADVWLTTLQMALVFGFEDCVERLEYKMARLQWTLSKTPKGHL